MDPLTDDSPMPWGKYQGTKLVNVPGHYLLWIYHNMRRSLSTGPVFDYIEDNLTIIQKECSQQTKEGF